MGDHRRLLSTNRQQSSSNAKSTIHMVHNRKVPLHLLQQKSRPLFNVLLLQHRCFNRTICIIVQLPIVKTACKLVHENSSPVKFALPNQHHQQSVPANHQPSRPNRHRPRPNRDRVLNGGNSTDLHPPADDGIQCHRRHVATCEHY